MAINLVDADGNALTGEIDVQGNTWDPQAWWAAAVDAQLVERRRLAGRAWTGEGWLTSGDGLVLGPLVVRALVLGALVRRGLGLARAGPRPAGPPRAGRPRGGRRRAGPATAGNSTVRRGLMVAPPNGPVALSCTLTLGAHRTWLWALVGAGIRDLLTTGVPQVVIDPAPGGDVPVAELFLMNVEFRRQAHSLTLAGVPLVLGVLLRALARRSSWSGWSAR